jgi:DNA-binding IclR family transcriptional regulator
VRDFTGKVVAAISASGTVGVITPDPQAQVSDLVVEAARAISRRLGWLGE